MILGTWAGLLSLSAAAVAAASCVTLMVAGIAERRGDVARSRRVARAGGHVGGAALVVALLGLTTVLASGRPFPPPRLVALVVSAGAGSACLLAGLAGKPRPTAAVATAVLLAGLTLAAALSQGTLRFP